MLQPNWNLPNFPGAAVGGSVGAKTLLRILVDLAVVEQPNKKHLEIG